MHTRTNKRTNKRTNTRTNKRTNTRKKLNHKKNTHKKNTYKKRKYKGGNLTFIISSIPQTRKNLPCKCKYIEEKKLIATSKIKSEKEQNFEEKEQNFEEEGQKFEEEEQKFAKDAIEIEKAIEKAIKKANKKANKKNKDTEINTEFEYLIKNNKDAEKELDSELRHRIKLHKSVLSSEFLINQLHKIQSSSNKKVNPDILNPDILKNIRDTIYNKYLVWLSENYDIPPEDKERNIKVYQLIEAEILDLGLSSIDVIKLYQNYYDMLIKLIYPYMNIRTEKTEKTLLKKIDTNKKNIRLQYGKEVYTTIINILHKNFLLYYNIDNINIFNFTNINPSGILEPDPDTYIKNRPVKRKPTNLTYIEYPTSEFNATLKLRDIMRNTQNINDITENISHVLYNNPLYKNYKEEYDRILTVNLNLDTLLSYYSLNLDNKRDIIFLIFKNLLDTLSNLESNLPIATKNKIEEHKEKIEEKMLSILSSPKGTQLDTYITYLKTLPSDVISHINTYLKAYNLDIKKMKLDRFIETLPPNIQKEIKHTERNQETEGNITNIKNDAWQYINPNKNNGRVIKDGNTPLHYAVLQGNIQKVQDLIDNGDNVNGKNVTGNTPLYLAVAQGDIDIVNVLIKANGINVNSKNVTGNTPLLHAVSINKLDIVNVLIDKGADVNIENDKHNTPLLYAVASNRLDIFNVLIDKGADVNIQNNDGYTPLHYASRKGNLQIVQALIDKGADVNIQNKDGKTPLDVAKASNYKDIKILLSLGIK